MNLKKLWLYLGWPILLSVVISVAIWASVQWYLIYDNLDTAIFALAFGIFMFLMKDLPLQYSNQKETD